MYVRQAIELRVLLLLLLLSSSAAAAATTTTTVEITVFIGHGYRQEVRSLRQSAHE